MELFWGPSSPVIGFHALHALRPSLLSDTHSISSGWENTYFLSLTVFIPFFYFFPPESFYQSVLVAHFLGVLKVLLCCYCVAGGRWVWQLEPGWLYGFPWFIGRMTQCLGERRRGHEPRSCWDKMHSRENVWRIQSLLFPKYKKWCRLSHWDVSTGVASLALPFGWANSNLFYTFFSWSNFRLEGSCKNGTESSCMFLT